MEQCPECRSQNLHRSRSRNKWEAWRKEITSKRLFRCRACGWRGWAADSAPRVDEVDRLRSEPVLALDLPNSKGIALVRSDRPGEEINLEELDALNAVQRASGDIAKTE
jgi:hypothetical protein